MAGTLLLAGGAWLVATQQIPSTVLLGLGAGILITPDLDVDHRTAEEARLWRIFPPLGWAWQIIWYPYALLIPHRSPWSHAPLMGTAVRLLYLGALLYGAQTLAGYNWIGALLSWPGLPWALLGWAAQDTLHWLLDCPELRCNRT